MLKFYSLKKINDNINRLSDKGDYDSDEFKEWGNEMFKTSSLYFCIYSIAALIFNYIMLP